MAHVCVRLVITEIHFLLLEGFHETLDFGIVMGIASE